MVDQLALEAADSYPGDPQMDVEVENSDVDSAATDGEPSPTTASEFPEAA